MNKVKISNHSIGDGSPTFIIAEVAQTHQGSIKKALSIVDQISKTGVDAIKFQTHIASEESTINEPFRVKFTKKYKNRYEYWKAMEFSEKNWKKIASYCNKKNLIFLSSPFSKQSVKILNKCNISAWKIASGEFFSNDLIDEVILYKKPLLISTGMSTMKEISVLLKKLKKLKKKFLLFQCTSEYPSQKKSIGLNMIEIFKRKFNCPAGLSDHSGNIHTLISAIAVGANIIECHVSFNDKKNNPDFSSSINLKELENLVNFRNHFFEIKKLNVNKEKISSNVKRLKKLFSKSLCPNKNLKKNHIIKYNDITEKKPGNGISPKYKNFIVGKKLKKDIKFNQLFEWGNFE